jgi:FAD/FMN-containing dehydrogenase
VQNNGDNTVTVSGGMKLWQLYEALAADGLALPNSGTQCTQTVAGALSTATHGTGDTGSMSSQIVSMRIVLANGETRVLSATQNVDLFNAARVGYGALGIITTVTLAVVPQFKLERIIIGPLPVADVKGYVTKLRGMYDGRVSMTYYPYASTVNNAIIILYAPTTADINECWKSGLGAPVTPAPATVFPDGWPAGTQACVDLAYKAMVLQGGTFEGCPNAYGTAMEMVVPEENAFDVLNWLIQYQNSPDVRNQYNENNGVLGQTDVRFVAADDIWLSPYYNRNSVVISSSILGNENTHFTGTEAQVATYLRDGLQAIALNYGGRAHPGKQNFFTADLMKQAFDHFCDFVQVRADVDPQGLFSNQWLETLFNVHVATVGAGGDTVVNCICPGEPVCQVAPSTNPSAQPSTNPAGTTLTMTAFPAPGSTTPIGGRFTNLPTTVTPTDYKVILYLQAASGGANWWIKPQPDSATALAADGTFLIPGWATYPTVSAGVQRIPC